MQERYKELCLKLFKVGTINLTDKELMELLYLEEDIKETKAQKEMIRVCA